MPAESKKQRRMMAIAEHHPEMLYRNRGVLKMSKEQLHDFASTPERGLREQKGEQKGNQKGGARVSYVERERIAKTKKWNAYLKARGK